VSESSDSVQFLLLFDTFHHYGERYIVFTFIHRMKRCFPLLVSGESLHTQALFLGRGNTESMCAVLVPRIR
jgi:hypothetical protein